MTADVRKKIAEIFMVIAFALGVGYFLFVQYLGGSALSGTIEEGRYFVIGLEGKVEVSALLYYVNLIHGIAAIIAILVAIFADIGTKINR